MHTKMAGRESPGDTVAIADGLGELGTERAMPSSMHVANFPTLGLTNCLSQHGYTDGLIILS